MKTLTTQHSRGFFILFVLLFSVSLLLSSLPAYSQIDFFYGKNTHGLRIGAGVGGSTLQTHYNDNPLQLVYTGNLDYNFNPYLSIGFEGQYGTLKGIDNHTPHHLFYTSSTNKYKAANFNVKASLGLIDDFYSQNAFMDAVKRLYIGAGVGIIKNSITFTYDPSLAQYAYGTPEVNGHSIVFPFNFGTNIDLPNILGYDRLEINPNFQFSYIPSMNSDGFISSQYSHLKGFYNVTSLSVKYKF